MNKDQVKGAGKETAGKAQKKFGEVVGSTEQRVKGAIKEIEGRTQKVAGDIKELVKDEASKPHP